MVQTNIIIIIAWSAIILLGITLLTGGLSSSDVDMESIMTVLLSILLALGALLAFGFLAFYFARMGTKIMMKDMAYMGFQPDEITHDQVILTEVTKQAPLNRMYAYLAYNGSLFTLAALVIPRMKKEAKEASDYAAGYFLEKNAFDMGSTYAYTNMRKEVRQAIHMERQLKVGREGNTYPLATYLFLSQDKSDEGIKISQQAWELRLPPECAPLLKGCTQEEIVQMQGMPAELLIQLLK